MKMLMILVVALFMISTAFTQEIDNIGMMLELQKKLNLSEKQIEQLMAFRKDLKKFYINQKAEYELQELELKEFYQDKEKNLNKIKAQYDKLALLKSAMEYAKLEKEMKALKVLNEEQKQGYYQFLEKWHHDKAQKEKKKKVKIEVTEDEIFKEEGHKEVIIEKHKGMKQEGHKEVEIIRERKGKEGHKAEKREYKVEELLERIQELEKALEEEKSKKK
jgi:hypothetical protein